MIAEGTILVPETDLRQELYLLADELRAIAALGGHYAANAYEADRADRTMEVAVKLAALAEAAPPEAVRPHFRIEAESWPRASPAVGVDAAVFDRDGRILLVFPKGNVGWAMPGGLADVGETPTEAALRELWEEAGLRGRATRLLGLFDGRRLGSRSKVHLLHLVFLVECEPLQPSPGVEIDDVGFFSPDDLPRPMRPGHERGVAKVVDILRGPTTYFDPADSSAPTSPCTNA